MTRFGVLLAPGAGADRNQSTLVKIDRALSAKEVAVTRMDFPYRKNGKKAPDRAPILIDAVCDEFQQLEKQTGLDNKSIFLGGRSLGGRMCSMAVAEGLECAGLILISYPLHPPGKPDKLRVEHFPQISVPCLFISGTRDAFGSPDELSKAIKAIAGEVTYVWIEGGDHGLRNKDDQVVDAVTAWLGK